MINERTIKIAAKLYECRDTAKSLAKVKGMDYQAMLLPYRKVIEQQKLTRGLEPLEAILQISKNNSYNEDGMTQLLFMAAAVEIMEPSI